MELENVSVASQMQTAKSDDSAAVFSADNVPVQGTGAGGAGAAAKPRTFGAPLDQLVVLAHAGVPRVVARLCHYIERHGMQTERLFSTPSNPTTNQRSVAKMRADFDTYGDCNLERYKDVAAAAGCLKTFLRELPEAVVPAQFTGAFVSALQEENALSSRCERLAALVQTLPSTHYAVLRFLCSFLRRVTSFHCASHMSAETLGVVFGPSVFRVSEEDSAGPGGLRLQAATSRLVTQLIGNYDGIFNASGQRFQPQSARSDKSDGPASGDQRCRIPESDGSVCSDGLQLRVDKSIQEAVNSHLLSALNSQRTDYEGGDRDRSSDRSLCKRREDDIGKSQEQRSSRSPDRQDIHQRRPHSTGCFRRTSNQSEVARATSGTRAKRSRVVGAITPRSRSSHQVSLEKREPVTVPLTPSYGSSKRWTAIYTENGIESGLSSGSSLCLDMPAASHSQQPASRNKPEPFTKPNARTVVRDRSCDRGQCCHSQSKKPLSSEMSVQGSDCIEDDVWGMHSERIPEDDVWGMHSEHAHVIPPLDLKGMGGDGEPVSPTLRRGKTWIEDTAVLSRRDSFALSEAEFLREQKRRERFKSSPPLTASAAATRTPAQRLFRQLRLNIANTQRALQLSDDQFQCHHGYKPSQADGQNDDLRQMYLQGLSQARKARKHIKRTDGSPVAVDASNSAGRNAHQEKNERTRSFTGTVKEERLEEAVALLIKRLNESRVKAGRPVHPETMSREEVLAEKTALQKALLGLEQKYGRPDSKQDRDLVRPLYERYRIIKRLSAKTSPSEVQNAQVIKPTASVVEQRKATITSLDQPGLPTSIRPVNYDRGDKVENQTHPHVLQNDYKPYNEDNLHTLPLGELKSHLNKAKEDKRRLRDKLLAFEEEFHSKVGRNVMRDDRAEMGPRYDEYKRLKLRMKLLEALIAKHETRGSLAM